jgi:flagellar basal-body rod protein FlgF
LPPNSEPSIAGDGSISARLPNGTSSVVGRLKLVTPEAKLERGTDGLFRASGGDPLDADATARVQDGALEGSNVSPVENMVAMISAARQFEAQMKLMQTAEANSKSAAQLLAAS